MDKMFYLVLVKQEDGRKFVFRSDGHVNVGDIVGCETKYGIQLGVVEEYFLTHEEYKECRFVQKMVGEDRIIKKIIGKLEIWKGAEDVRDNFAGEADNEE